MKVCRTCCLHCSNLSKKSTKNWHCIDSRGHHEICSPLRHRSTYFTKAEIDDYACNQAEHNCGICSSFSRLENYCANLRGCEEYVQDVVEI